MDTVERAGVTAAIVMLAVALGTLAQWPPRDLSVTLLHQTIQARLSAQWVLALLAGSLAAVGTHSFASGHPVAIRKELSHTAHYWPLPAILAAAATLALARPMASPFRLIGLAVAGCLVLGTLLAEYVTIAGTGAPYERARWTLNLIAYAVAMTVFEVALTSTLPPPTVSVACGIAAGLLTVELLRQPRRTPDRVAVYVVLFAVLGAITTWRLLLMPEVSPHQAGLLLLAQLYVLTGSAQQRLRGRLSWGLSIELGMLYVIGSVAILKLVP